MEKRAKIAVLVSGGGTSLQALIDFEKAGKLKHGKLSLVLSNKPGVYALERAEKAGIQTCVVDKKSFPDRERFESEILNVLSANNIDMIVLAGFMCILSESFTSRFPERMINVHPSLIPSFCGEGFYGLHVHEAALSYGVKVTGATVHFVNEVPDGGRIILQKAVPVHRNDTPETLQRRVMERAEWKILPRAAEIVATGIVSSEKSKEV